MEQSLENQAMSFKSADAPAESAPSAGSPGGAGRKVVWYGLFGAVGAVAAVLVALGVYRVYALAATDAFSLGVARVLRLPAARVNGTSIAYADYAEDRAAINSYREYERSVGGGNASLTDEQMSDQVLVRLVNNVLLLAGARQFNLTVAESEVSELRDQVIKQFGSVAQADAEIKKRYGWNFDQYQTKVMRPFILQNKLAEKISSDAAARAKLRQESEGLLARLKGGEDFAALAKQYGQDGTAPQGGDLGWFGKGEMVPQFEAAAFALKKGELAAAPVESPYGYHLVKVDDKRVGSAKDDSGKTVRRDEVRARHILLRFPGIDTYFDQALRSARIKIYLKVHNPFTALTSPPGKV